MTSEICNVILLYNNDGQQRLLFVRFESLFEYVYLANEVFYHDFLVMKALQTFIDAIFIGVGLDGNATAVASWNLLAN